jgi:hypothetical protein
LLRSVRHVPFLIDGAEGHGRENELVDKLLLTIFDHRFHSSQGESLLANCIEILFLTNVRLYSEFGGVKGRLVNVNVTETEKQADD